MAVGDERQNSFDDDSIPSSPVRTNTNTSQGLPSKDKTKKGIFKKVSEWMLLFSIFKMFIILGPYLKVNVDLGHKEK